MEKKLNVKLLKYTPVPANVIATAARLCYSKSEINDLLDKMTDEKCEELLEKLINLGHESPLEHAYFTFGIEGISRACSHQLVRHRIASYSQQSQRYVDSKEFNYIIPPSIKKDESLTQEYEEMMLKIGEFYEKLREISPKEDARFILPNAAETKIIVTMNARSLKNFFKHRICKRAQWEIQAMAREMLKACKEVAPTLFNNMGAPCVTDNICPEGDMSCGIWLNMANTYIKLKGKLMNKEEFENVKGNR